MSSHDSTSLAPSRAPFTRPQRLLILAAFALLVALRLPHAWAQGRFLDEEGSVFLAYAWHHTAAEALIRPFGGYLNLAANALTLLTARLTRDGPLPLEAAPYVTMVAALLFQLLPAVLLLTGCAAWLARRRAVVAALLIVVARPMTEEVFLNTLHIQFHLMLAAALVLAFDVPRSRAGRAGYAAILLLAPLCGPGAIVLLPLFALRWLVDRDRGRLIQLLVFAGGAAAQLLLFFSGSPVRGGLLDPATLLAILFGRLVALPLVGTGPANALGRIVLASWTGGGIGWWIVVVAAAAVFATLIVVALRRYRGGAVWLILAGLGIAAASFGGGMIAMGAREWFSVGAGERYNFVPLACLGLALVALAARGGRSARIWQALVVLTIVIGAIAYPKPIRELSQGPGWADEVARWRRDHDHPLVAWPTSWEVDLSDRARPCTPPQPGATISTDPSYCESAWLARVEADTLRAKAQAR